MKILATTAACTVFALSACGPESDLSQETGTETPSSVEQGIVGLSPSSNMVALFDRHLKNQGATNTCAWQNGIFLNTQACSSAANQVFSIYQPKGNSRVMACNSTSVTETSRWQTCLRQYFSSTGQFLSSTNASCYLSYNSGTCITTGTNSDVRLGYTIIDQNYETVCVGSNCGFIVQNFYGGKLRWAAPDDNTLFTVEGAFIKANNGKYLKRLSTQIVTATSPLVTTDTNFQWLLY